jgi:hypothetical protein
MSLCQLEKASTSCGTQLLASVLSRVSTLAFSQRATYSPKSLPAHPWRAIDTGCETHGIPHPVDLLQ